MIRKRWAVALALASLLVLAGCSGSSGDAQLTNQAGGSDLAATEAAEQDADDSAGESAFQNQQRSLIRTGEVSLRVESFDESRRNLVQETEARGGFVSDSSERVHRRGNRSWTSGELVLRVPADNYSALLERVKAEGEVRHAKTNTEDVTDQLVDVEARLENLRAQRERLRDLYEEANDTENVLAVQERLSEVQSEIERLEARRESLRRQVAYSTITVEMEEERPDAPTPDRTEWHETGLLAAFFESANGVVVVARGLAVGAAYAAPYVLAFGVPLGAVYGVWRRRRTGGIDVDEPTEPREDEGATSTADDE